MRTFLFAIIFFQALAFAGTEKAPENFKVGDSLAVFVDFHSANYEITYDVQNKTATAVTTIKFYMPVFGKPIFDLVPDGTAKIFGRKVALIDIEDPDQESEMKMIDRNIKAGNHTVVIYNRIDDNINFSFNAVASAFWMSDLSDRSYLEQYIPTNIEYDQYKMHLTVKVVGTDKRHEIFTNGQQRVVSKNHFEIDYPEYFTSSSLYFHMTKKDKYPSTHFTYKSIDGRDIPVVIYTRFAFKLNSLKEDTIKVLTELEGKFGPWGHPSLTIYNSGSGGMEYAGATITSKSALGHELTHSYFARGVMPVNGNSGWMDEAIASWRDEGYKSVSAPYFTSTTMAAHSQYRRTTDRKAYAQGANFMAYLNHELQRQGGLRSFLEKIFAKWLHSNITTKDFEKELEQFSGRNFSAEFNQYIYGSANVNTESEKAVMENPYHPRLTKQQLFELL